jgi:DNA-directed RNA polymerase subunit RPC12/RpoP
MDTRIFHGDITPQDLAHSLIAHFNRGNFRVQRLGQDDLVTIQIATQQQPRAGGQTALTVQLQKVEDGVAVHMGKQAWLGVAASLGTTALSVWRNPLSLLSRLDDLAQDIESLQLSEQVWQVIENAARALGASFELSERLRRVVCAYCRTPNPLIESHCMACGAPLAEVQPRTCKTCGFIVNPDETECPNCGQKF